MDANPSSWQEFKLRLAQYVSIDRDVLHVLLGLTLLMGALFVVRRRFRLWPVVLALVVAAMLGVGMEVPDLRDDLQSLGRYRWGASVLDIGRTVLFPALGLAAALWYRARRTAH